MAIRSFALAVLFACVSVNPDQQQALRNEAMARITALGSLGDAELAEKGFAA